MAPIARIRPIIGNRGGEGAGGQKRAVSTVTRPLTREGGMPPSVKAIPGESTGGGTLRVLFYDNYRRWRNTTPVSPPYDRPNRAPDLLPDHQGYGRAQSLLQ